MTTHLSAPSRLRLLCASAAASALLSGPAQALPTGGVVVANTPGAGASFTVAGKLLTVNQNSQRVVIDWRSFNIASDEAVNFKQASNAIAFNRINSAGPASIDGSLSGRGGVWLFSPGGLLFGSTAQVNVGSFIASTATLSNGDIDQALTIAPPGQVNTISASPSDGSGSIRVNAGAVIKSKRTGFVALVGENIVQAGSIRGGAVGYIVAKAAQAQYIETGNGVVLTSDITTSGQADVRFNHTGSTRAGLVLLLAPAAAANQGFAGAINLGGVVEAVGVAIPGIPTGVVARVGDDYAGSGGQLTLNTTGGRITSTTDVTLSAYDARLGQITGQNISAVASHSLLVKAPVQAGGNVNLVVLAPGGQLTVNSDLAALGAINLSGYALSIGKGVTVNAGAGGASGDLGALNVFAARSIAADPTSLLITGSREGDPTAPVIVRAGTINEGGAFGGSIALGQVVGSTVDVQAIGAAGIGGDITLAGAVYGVDGVSVLSTAADAEPTAARISILDQVASNGAIHIANADGGDVSLGAAALVQSDRDGDGQGDLSIVADRSVTGAAASQLLGGASTADVSVIAGQAPSGGNVTVGRVSGSGVILSAAAGSGTGGDITTLDLVSSGPGGASIVGDGAARLAELRSEGDISVAMGGDIHVLGDMTALGALTLQATNIDLGRVVLRADADGDGAGDIAQAQQLSVLARRNVTAGYGSLLATGSGEGDPSAPVVVRAGSINEQGSTPGSITVFDVAGSLADIRAVGGSDEGGAITLAGSVYGKDSVTVSSTGDTAASISILAQVASEGGVEVTNADGGDILLGQAAVVQSDLNGEAQGGVVLVADRSVVGDAASRVLGGSRSADVYVSSGTAGGGGDLTVGRVQGSTVTLASNGGEAVRGDLTTLGLVEGADAVSIRQSGGPTTGGGVNVGADVRSDGSVSVEATRDVAFAAETSVQAHDGFGEASLQVTTPSGVSVGAGAQLTGDKGLAIDARGLLSVGEGALVQGGYGSEVPGDYGWPNAVFDAGQGGVYLHAADLDIQGDVRSVGPEARGDIFLNLDGSGVVGGAGSSSGGFDISDAEFAHFNGRNVLIAASSDLSVGDLSLDASRVSELWLGASPEGRLTVSGSLRSVGQGEGAASVRIGFNVQGPIRDFDRAFQPSQVNAIPGEVMISGSLGGDGKLDQVSIVAGGDILMGSDAYLEAASSDPNFNPAKSTAAAPAQGHLFVQADGLQLSSGTRILQQNTGTKRQYAGLLVGAPTADRPLILGFGQGDQVSRLPTVIDLYGELIGAQGVRIAGRKAADAPFLLQDGVTALEDYKFNACSFGRGFACVGETRPHYPTPLDIVAGQTSQSFEAVVSVVQTFLNVPQTLDEDDRDVLGLPVTGSGNGDLWIGEPSDGDQP